VSRGGFRICYRDDPVSCSRRTVWISAMKYVYSDTTPVVRYRVWAFRIWYLLLIRLSTRYSLCLTLFTSCTQTTCTKCCYEETIAPHPSQKLEAYLLSVVQGCLFSVFIYYIPYPEMKSSWYSVAKHGGNVDKTEVKPVYNGNLQRYNTYVFRTCLI
jgi:hypothetical protein